MDPLFFLNSENYGVYNRQLAGALGLVTAVVLSELIQKRQYHTDRNELISDKKYGDGWFYNTIDAMEQRLGVLRRDQDSSIKRLKELGCIETATFGLPARRYFRIVDDKVFQVLGLIGYENNKKQIARLAKTPNLDACGCEGISVPDDSSTGQNLDLKNKTLDWIKRQTSMDKTPNCAPGNSEGAIHSTKEPKDKNSNITQTHVAAVAAPAADAASVCESGSAYHEERSANPSSKAALSQTGSVPRDADASNSSLNPPRIAQKESGDSKRHPSPKKRLESNSRGSLEFGEFVRMSEHEYATLCEQNSKQLVDIIIDEMNDYCAASRPKGYSSYAAAVRQWIRRRKTEKTGLGAPRYETAHSRVKRQQMERWVESNGNPDDNPNILKF